MFSREKIITRSKSENWLRKDVRKTYLSYKLIFETKQESFSDYIPNTVRLRRNYSLWTATHPFKQLVVRIPPLRDEYGSWLRHDKKVELFVRHLLRLFQPHNIQSKLVFNLADLPKQTIKFVIPFEVSIEIISIPKNLQGLMVYHLGY